MSRRDPAFLEPLTPLNPVQLRMDCFNVIMADIERTIVIPMILSTERAVVYDHLAGILNAAFDAHATELAMVLKAHLRDSMIKTLYIMGVFD